MSLKQAMLSTSGVIVTATVLTLLVFVESIYSPTAPFFVLYALFAILIPLVLGAYRFGILREAFRSRTGLILGIFLLVLLCDVVIVGVLYDALLGALGLTGQTFYSLNAAIAALLDKAGRQLGIGPENAQMIFAGYFVLWAPLGEELFYRGYIQGTLRKAHSFRTAALLSAAFFGIRHATHLFYLAPDVPIVAQTVWVIDAFVIGLLFSYLYEKTGSLWPPLVVHFVVNLLGILLSAVAGQ